MTLLVFYVYLEYNKTDYIHTKVLVKDYNTTEGVSYAVREYTVF